MSELKKGNKKMNLRDTLFWDVNPATLDPGTSKMLIMERVLTRGNIAEFKQLIGFYPLHEICRTVVKIGYMDKRTLNFISDYLNIPKSDFLCYKKKQSNLTHWNS